MQLSVSANIAITHTLSNTSSKSMREEKEFSHRNAHHSLWGLSWLLKDGVPTKFSDAPHDKDIC